jgi:putative pyrroloquinoline-quinone binding quinoprotein
VSAENEPWSPFPVQDWSSLPEDPLAYTAVDPSWAPPRPDRPWWLPLVVLALVGALIGGATFAWNTVGFTTARTAATAFLPADGTAVYEVVETTRESATDRSSQVTESARFRGVTGLLSTDATFGSKLFAEVGEHTGTVQIWRTISSVYDDPAAPHPTTRMYRTDDAVELLGETGPSGGFVYRPALVELPADVTAGSRWTGSGSANDVLDYSADFQAAAGNEDCLEVTGEVRYASRQGQPARTVSLQRTWCRDRGLVAATESYADLVSRTVQTATSPPRPPDTRGPLPRWTAPDSWTEHKLDSISIDPTFGQGPVSGAAKALAPVRTESGLVVRATEATNDLVAFTPKTREAWVSAWRAHVPGRILTLRAFGNVILVTTSARRLVAYSDLGIRLWHRDLEEIAAAPAVRVSDSDVVVTDLAGDVRRLALATGAELWQHRLGADVTVPPAVGHGLVVAMDRGGTVTALDEATGQRRWTEELEGKGAGFVGRTLVVLQDQTAHGLDPASGERRWLRPFLGIYKDLAPLADRLALATDSATVLVDESGQVTARLPGYLRLTPSADRLVGWGPREAEVIDASGSVSRRWPLPDLTLAVQDRPAVALPEGVLLTNNDWTFTIWNDER